MNICLAWNIQSDAVNFYTYSSTLIQEQSLGLDELDVALAENQPVLLHRPNLDLLDAGRVCNAHFYARFSASKSSRRKAL